MVPHQPLFLPHLSFSDFPGSPRACGECHAHAVFCGCSKQGLGWGVGAQTMTTAVGNQDGQCGQEEQTQDPATGPQAGTWRPGPRLDRGSQGTPVPTVGLCFPPSEDMSLD